VIDKEIDMKSYITKPLPDDELHTQSDEAIKFLIKTYMGFIKDDEHPSYIKCVKDRINAMYKVLGYRCALEYLEKYGD
jgi:hypothetical protein